MSFQNTIKSMNKFNRSTLREIQLPTYSNEPFGGENIRNEISELQNILQEIKQEATSLTPRFEEIFHSPRKNLDEIKNKKLELEKKMLTPLSSQLTSCIAKQLKPSKPKKVIISKIANNK